DRPSIQRIRYKYSLSMRLVRNLHLPLTVAVGREGDALARAGLYTQSVNPLPFYHHNQLTVIFGGRAP
ncbi:LOW QUALITY PROTEIN: hypothetical protein HMPREF0012_01947, partial [Acinetobacter calcoaceticus RUH2202]